MNLLLFFPIPMEQEENDKILIPKIEILDLYIEIELVQRYSNIREFSMKVEMERFEVRMLARVTKQQQNLLC